MTPKAAANRYARALFDVAQRERLDLDRLDRELTGFSDAMTAHEDLRRVLSHPAIPPARKRAVVERLVAANPVSPQVGRLLVMLAERDRLVLLQDLARAFRERVMDHRQVVRAEVTTAVQLPADRVEALRKGIAAATGRQVELETRVDPSIVGGAVTRIGSTVYDGSVTTQLQRLREQLAQAES